MWNRSRIFGLGFTLTVSALVAIVIAHNAPGQSGTRSGGGGFGNGGGAPAGGGGGGGGGTVSGGGVGGRTLDPLGLAHNLILSGQAGGGSGGGERNPAVPIAERLSQYLVTAQYHNWSPVPGQTNDFSRGVGPHGAFVKTYVNRNVASDPQEPNYGAILLQENYSKDKTRLLDVTVMLRIKGFDAAHNDWFWAQYLPNGALAREGQTKLAGQVTSCINCHSHAEGRDFIFSNSHLAAR